MGAVFAGAARAPITAVVILFELTGEYTIILPLMLAIVLATAVSELVSKDTVYTRKLLRRGIDIDEPADSAMRRRPVSSVMVEPPEPIAADDSLVHAAHRFASGGESSLPVVDKKGRYLGNLAAHDLLDALAAAERTSVSVLTTGADSVAPDSTLGGVLRRLDYGADAVPVASPDGILLGWVRQRDMLSALTNVPG